MSEKHNKLYYEQGRNGYIPSDTWQKEVIEDKDNKWCGGEINPKMKLSKEDLMKHDPLFDKILKEKVKDCYTGDSNHHRIVREGFELKDNRIPDYYIGNNGYEARKVIDNFELSYNVGTATTYLLRCGKKKEEGMTDTEKHIEDLQKAKNHIDFEIERLKQ